jgi:hypothetical protein
MLKMLSYENNFIIHCLVASCLQYELSYFLVPRTFNFIYYNNTIKLLILMLVTFTFNFPYSSMSIWSVTSRITVYLVYLKRNWILSSRKSVTLVTENNSNEEANYYVSPGFVYNEMHCFTTKDDVSSEIISPSQSRKKCAINRLRHFAWRLSQKTRKDYRNITLEFYKCKCHIWPNIIDPLFLETPPEI